MKKHKRSFMPLAVLLVVISMYVSSSAGQLPEGFVYLEKIVPDITVELRYYTEDNFVGKRIDGYIKPQCILTDEAALALKKAQEDLKPFGLGLKVYDAYRPQLAVDHFVRWAKDLEDTKMKEKYYPNVLKKNLFKEGYIASRSGHTRGSTVDVTIINLESRTELDMGSGFDFFSPKSWSQNPDLTASQRAHRMLLQSLMIDHGFEPYKKEWWHFTLKKEPFPDKYFNFPVQ